MKTTTIFIFTLALFLFLISIPTVKSARGSRTCIVGRVKKGMNNPLMIPTNRPVVEKDNVLEPQTAEMIDEDEALLEERTNFLRSKNSNRNPKKVKLNVDVNINLRKD